MLWKRAFFTLSVILLSLTVFSCQLFENDVSNFMEMYTETAAIDNHEISVNTYLDASANLCISSEEKAELLFYMRNPKKFRLNPYVSFNELNSQIDRSQVSLVQTDDITVKLTLPQDFLIASDEGQDITAQIGLYEPMSGREFDKYKVKLNCNTIPPAILNPTVMNNNSQTFVIAFDMPNEEEVAIRHKDISEVLIDGTSYPVSITTETGTDGLNHAVYTFSDPRFSRNQSSSYISINQKNFVHTRNSVYFETNEPFAAIDKEYTLVLKDSAGLSTTVKASTVISKLVKPVIKNQKGAPISENGMTGIPFDEDIQKGRITIEPPTQDHLGNPVSGATVHYKVYEATGSGLIYTSGSSTEEVTLELPQNTYRVEAYATLLNYETSATRTVRFRFENNVLYVNPDSVNGDGSEAAPWASIAQAFADINNPDRRREIKFTICLEGDLQEDVVIDDSLNLDELEFEKKAGASIAKIKSLTINGTKTVILNDMTISNPAQQGVGIKLNANANLTLNRIDITGCSWYGLQLTSAAGTVDYNNGTISGNSSNNSGKYCGNTAVYVQGGTCNLTDLAVNNNSDFGLVLENSAVCNLKNTTVNNNGFGLYLASTTAVCNLEDVTVTGNSGGVDLKSEFAGTTGSGGKLNVKGNIVINNNGNSNVILSANGAGSTVHVTGALSSTSRIGITPASLPTGDDKLTVTSGYSTYNSGIPGYIFFSDAAYGIMLYGGEAAISQSQGIVSNQYEYTVEFKPADGSSDFNTTITPGQAKTISVTPVIKRNGLDITSTVSASELEWNIFVICHGDTIKTSTTNSITLDAASVNNEVYYVNISLTYKGRIYDRQLRLAPDSGLSANEVIFDSTSINDLKSLIENAADGTVIIMKNGVSDITTTINIDVPNGRTVTLKRSSDYTGSFFMVDSGLLNINSTNGTSSGNLIIDGGSGDGIVATAPLLVDIHTTGTSAIYNVTFKNNNNANGNGGAAFGGNTAITTFFNCSFINCRAKNGGALYYNYQLTLQNCSVQSCNATEYGGGLYLAGYIGSAMAYITNQANLMDAQFDEIADIITDCTAGIGGSRLYFYQRGSTQLTLNDQNITYTYSLN